MFVFVAFMYQFAASEHRYDTYALRTDSLHCYIHCIVSYTAQTINTSPDDTTCTAGATSCTINVSGNGGSPYTYTCPTTPNCDQCTLTCSGSYACAYATVLGKQCANVNITSTSNNGYVMAYMRIHGPTSGNLFIDIDVDADGGFKESWIISQNTNYIRIETSTNSSDNVAEDIRVFAEKATYYKQVCGSGCKNQEIHCPLNDNIDGTSCIIDCTNVEGSNKCQSNDIYTQYGTPRDVRYVLL